MPSDASLLSRQMGTSDTITVIDNFSTLMSTPDVSTPTVRLVQDFEDGFTKADSPSSQSLVLDSTLDGSPATGGFVGAEEGTVYYENASLYMVESQQDLRWMSSYTIYALMVTSGCVGTLVLLINISLLAASKLASGGRTPMLIFLRSLCVADALIGVFGMIKMTQFIPAMTWTWVNCFLPESILFTATIASNLTHVMLSTMCFSMLKDMVRFDRKQDKHRSIFSMTFLWNGSFVLGFVPHMGWNLDDHLGWNSVNRKCLFLRYVTQSYLGLVTAIISLCIAWLLVVHVAVQILICRKKFQDPSLLELTSPVIYATRIDIVLQLTCYLPGALYIFLNCDSCAYVAGQKAANDNLSALLPLMIVRATCSTALHFKRTDQMRDILYYCLKVVKHNIMVKSGSKNTKRPVRPLLHHPSRYGPSTETQKPQVAFPSPKTQSSHHLCTSPKKGRGVQVPEHRTPSPLVLSGSQPTITEETLVVDTTSPGEDLSPAMSSAPSWSTSNMTIASTVGSNSGGSSNGVSPFTRQKGVTKSATTQNGIKTSAKSPVEMKDLPSAGSMGPHSQYWVGEIPKRDSQTFPPPTTTAPHSTMTSPVGNVIVPASPHPRLLWTKSPLTSHLNSNFHSKGPKEEKKQINNESMGILSARRLDAEFGKWKLPKGNILQSEVIVHVPAETRMT